MVKLPLPADASIDEVIPSHVVVKRCAGVCHQGNVYHQCVPNTGSRVDRKVEVLFRRTDSDGQGSLECSTVSVEEHESCKCGCDVEAVHCKDTQVRIYVLNECTECTTIFLSFQVYDHHFCKCRCRDSDARAKCHAARIRKFWDDANCRCVCRQEEYKECSTGFVFDPIDTCE